MANYLICDNCQHKNTVTSERIVFCKKCDKKLANNYLDWKKSKFDSSFETYIVKETTESGEVIEVIKSNHKDKESIFKRTKSFISSNNIPEIKIFTGTTIVLLVLFFILTNNSVTTNYSSKNQISTCLSEVKWGNYPITQTLSLSVPFELKESESVLPCYMENYISNHKSQKAESSSQSFSVTIEKMDFDSYYRIQHSDFVSVNDAYMKRPDVDVLKEEGLHTMIKGYKTYVEHGSYFKDGEEYLYENYTLTKGDEGVKIILSYLKSDSQLCQYADIVTQSLLKNKTII